MGITQNTGASSLIKAGVIDNTAARPASPYEGQVIFQKDTDELLAYNGTSWTRPWNMPWGKTAKQAGGTNTGPTTVNVGYTVISLNPTIVPNRLYKISGQLVYQPYVNTMTQCMLYITGSGITTRTLYYQNGLSTPAYNMAFLGGSTNVTAAELGVTTGNGTATTLNLVVRGNVYGYINEDPDAVLGSGTNRTQFLIEDIGPA